MQPPEPDPEQMQREADPDAPGLAAARPLDDPDRGDDAEPGEPA